VTVPLDPRLMLTAPVSGSLLRAQLIRQGLLRERAATLPAAGEGTPSAPVDAPTLRLTGAATHPSVGVGLRGEDGPPPSAYRAYGPLRGEP